MDFGWNQTNITERKWQNGSDRAMQQPYKIKCKDSIRCLFIMKGAKNMEFLNFTEVIKEEVEKKAGNNKQVYINHVNKNNGVILCGLTIKEDDVNISPTIYLNNYYESYENGRLNITSIVDRVLETYENNKSTRSVDMRFFMDYNRIKNRMIYKLVNYELNEELLQDIPHIRFLDLAIVFQCLISEEKYGNATILIHNAHMKLWNITSEDLYKAASVNTPILQRYEIKNMKDVITELYEEQGIQPDEYEMENSIPMYVLSNKSRIQGAACILYPDMLKDFATAVRSDFYILPSSTHEVILLPVQEDDDINYLRNKVMEVNSCEVEPEEVLSNSVYYYSRESAELTII